MVLLHPGEAKVEPVSAESQAAVINAEEVQNGGLDVMNVDGILDYVKAQFVRLTDADARLYAAPGKPHGEGLRMMVTTFTSTQGGAGLNHGCAPEFASPDDERILQHATQLEVLYKGGTCLVSLLGLVPYVALHVGVGVPTRMINLDESDTAFGEATGQ